jgi:hypothetical protein
MIALAKYFSSIIENGKRIIKSKGIGGSVMTTKEVGPFGFDAQPPEGMTAIYADTTNADESVIIGYINKNQVAGIGESRMYSVGPSGDVRANILCDSSGRISLNGNVYNSVRYEPLEYGLNSQNVLINAEFAKIALVLNSLAPGSYTVAPVSTNITAAKSDTIKIK